LTGEEISNTETDPDNPATYEFKRESNKIDIQPVNQDGYDLVGWYIYQNAEQNANWNENADDTSYEPVDEGVQPVYKKLASRNGVLQLEAGNTNFGDITLIAKFVPAYTDLNIIKNVDASADANQSFLFHVTGEPYNDELADIDMTVMIEGDGNAVIRDLPVGEYAVTEITDWSWRYGYDSAVFKKNGQSIETVEEDPVLEEMALDDSEAEYSVTFANSREDIYWLSGDSYKMNLFTKPITTYAAYATGIIH